MPVTDRYVIRNMNEDLVLRIIIQRDSISRADISKETLLNKATVSSIVADLLERKLLVELGEGQSNGGRKPILVRFNHEAAIALSADLRPDRIALMFAYLNGDILLQVVSPKMEMTLDTILPTLLEMIAKNLPNLPKTHYGAVGLTLSIHGIVNHDMMPFSPFYDFDTLDMKAKLEQALRLPVFLENEANLGALGEKNFSTPSSNLIFINVKYGLGAGIILNNKLFTGANGFAGEVGHMIAVPDGIPCPCGNRGCLEQYASELKILNRYFPEDIPEKEKLLRLKADYAAGHSEAVSVIGEFADYLAIGLNNLMTAFNPSVIVINCYLLDDPEVLKLVKSKLTYRLNGRTLIKSSTLHNNAILLGGIHVAANKFLGI